MFSYLADRVTGVVDRLKHQCHPPIATSEQPPTPEQVNDWVNLGRYPKEAAPFLKREVVDFLKDGGRAAHLGQISWIGLNPDMAVERVMKSQRTSLLRTTETGGRAALPIESPLKFAIYAAFQHDDPNFLPPQDRELGFSLQSLEKQGVSFHKKRPPISSLKLGYPISLKLGKELIAPSLYVHAENLPLYAEKSEQWGAEHWFHNGVALTERMRDNDVVREDTELVYSIVLRNSENKERLSANIDAGLDYLEQLKADSQLPRELTPESPIAARLAEVVQASDRKG